MMQKNLMIVFDIRFALSQRFESIGNLYKAFNEKRNDALDYYKRAITIREELFAESASEKSRIALSNAYLSVGKLYSLYTSNKDYLWRAISYFDQAVALTGTTHEDPALFEQRAIAYHSIAKVYREEDAYDKNIYVAYDYFNRAITYYEKLLWKSSPEYIWMIILDCYYEKATLLLRIVEKIDEENNKTTKLLQSFPFDSTKRNEYIHESVNSFHKVLYYYDKLYAVDYRSSELLTTSVKTLYMLAGATILLPEHYPNIGEDYLVRGKEAVYKLKNILTDVELFLLYYDIYMFFLNMSIKNKELQVILDESLNYLNELLPFIKNNDTCNKEAIMFVEMSLHGFSKQYGKMISYIPKLFVGAWKEGFS